MRRVFFSFHYQRDIWKVSQIRNSQLFSLQTQTFVDKAEWEKLKRTGASAIQRWIDEQMWGTSVTVVLIGAETYARPWVQYEILKSHRERRGMFGVQLAGMREHSGLTDTVVGPDPFAYLRSQGQLDQTWGYPVYNWTSQNGRANMNDWIAQAAVLAGR